MTFPPFQNQGKKSQDYNNLLENLTISFSVPKHSRPKNLNTNNNNNNMKRPMPLQCNGIELMKKTKLTYTIRQEQVNQKRNSVTYMKTSHSVIERSRNPKRNLTGETAIADREGRGIGKCVRQYQIIEFRRIKQSAFTAHNFISKRNHQTIKPQN